MSRRTVIRPVTHRMVQHPDTDVTYEGLCLSCEWSSKSTDGEKVNVECLRHAGRSNHRGFRRVVTGFAFVVRDGEEDPVR
ncbi:hypothetical protein [Streptomyces sp. NPDC057509]|uniref:DUF7848 domain-containing protein n=1 Tax=Streptomyces sp. NPDC057509 TaxID=3346152 RepID=UPI003676E90B